MKQIILQVWPGVLDMDMVAAYTTMSTATLWRAKFRRALTPVLLSKRRVGFLREDVDAWLRSRRMATPIDQARLFGGRAHRRKA